MVLYFTGTGNSRYVAQRIAEALRRVLKRLMLRGLANAHDKRPLCLPQRCAAHHKHKRQQQPQQPAFLHPPALLSVFRKPGLLFLHYT